MYRSSPTRTTQIVTYRRSMPSERCVAICNSSEPPILLSSLLVHVVIVDALSSRILLARPRSTAGLGARLARLRPAPPRLTPGPADRTAYTCHCRLSAGASARRRRTAHTRFRSGQRALLSRSTVQSCRSPYVATAPANLWRD
jgi:hypothetical protein